MNWLRRPSTWVLLGAGLLAADLLRAPLNGGWSDATRFFGCVLLILALAARFWPRRTPHKREVEMLALPSRAKPSIPVKPFPPARRGERPASPAS